MLEISDGESVQPQGPELLQRLKTGPKVKLEATPANAQVGQGVSKLFDSLEHNQGRRWIWIFFDPMLDVQQDHVGVGMLQENPPVIARQVVKEQVVKVGAGLQQGLQF